jgi:hypothetical protein
MIGGGLIITDRPDVEQLLDWMRASRDRADQLASAEVDCTVKTALAAAALDLALAVHRLAQLTVVDVPPPTDVLAVLGTVERFAS